MTRLRAAALAGLTVALAALTLRTAPAQPAAAPADRLYFLDRAKDGKSEVVLAELKESAAGVQVIGLDKKLTQTVSPADVIRIEYSALKGVDKEAYAEANRLDAGPEANPTKGAAAFAALLQKAGATADPQTKRALLFRQLMLAVRANDAESDDAKFAAAAAPLADQLTTFARAYPKHWECWPTARTAARLLVELRKPSEAAVRMRELSDNADLAAELRNDARLAEIGYLLMTPGRAAQTALAEARKVEASMTERQKEEVAILVEVLALPEPEPVPANLPSEEAEAKAAAAAKKLREAVARMEAANGVIGKAKDGAARAAGYNALGEVYRRHGLGRDAMWSYLWVDVVYNQDRDEQVKALVRLVQWFKEKQEDEREKQFRDRLLKARG